MDPIHQPVQPFLRGQSAFIGRLREIVTVFDPLQEAGYSNLDKFIQVAGRDCQEFHSLQQRVRFVLRLLQYPLVESHP